MAGAAASTYTVTSDDVGQRIRVQVTAGNAGGSGTSQSAATDPVTPPADVAATASGDAATVGAASTQPGDATAAPTDGTASTP